MPITTLDPRTALVVVDLQKGIAGAQTVPHAAAEVVARAARLAEAFRAAGLPVVLVNVDGMAPGRTDPAPPRPPFPPGWDELVPELDAQPSDLHVTKRTWGAFAHTTLEAQLRAHGVTQVVVCGIATSAGVESTARAAHELGFNVTLPTDAMADRNAEAHEGSVARVFPRIGETGATADVLALLARRE